MCADGLSSYHANQMSGVYVSCLAPISLAKAASPVGGSWNAKIISIAEEKQPVGMFPLGCLEWINLSNCLSSVDILYTHTYRASQEHTHKQAGKQIHTNVTFAHMYQPRFYMVCWSFPQLFPVISSAFSYLTPLKRNQKYSLFFDCWLIQHIYRSSVTEITAVSLLWFG